MSAALVIAMFVAMLGLGVGVVGALWILRSEEAPPKRLIRPLVDATPQPTVPRAGRDPDQWVSYPTDG